MSLTVCSLESGNQLDRHTLHYQLLQVSNEIFVSIDVESTVAEFVGSSAFGCLHAIVVTTDRKPR